MLASSSITAFLKLSRSPWVGEAQWSAAPNDETTSTAAEVHLEVERRARAAAGKPISVAPVPEVAAVVAEEPGGRSAAVPEAQVAGALEDYRWHL